MWAAVMAICCGGSTGGRRGAESGSMLTGVDLNPDAIRAAKEATPPVSRSSGSSAMRSPKLRLGDVDVVVCSLLTHHLTDPQIVQFLRWMERTARLRMVRQRSSSAAGSLPSLSLACATPEAASVRQETMGRCRSGAALSLRIGGSLCAAAGLAAESVSIREYRPARLCVGRIK